MKEVDLDQVQLQIGMNPYAAEPYNITQRYGRTVEGYQCIMVVFEPKEGAGQWNKAELIRRVIEDKTGGNG